MELAARIQEILDRELNPNDEKLEEIRGHMIAANQELTNIYPRKNYLHVLKGYLEQDKLYINNMQENGLFDDIWAQNQRMIASNCS